MLAYWLPNTTHTLPVNATHRVGVGAFIMNDKREVQNEFDDFKDLACCSVTSFKDPKNIVNQLTMSYDNRIFY
jgi:hypothetical protein